MVETTLSEINQLDDPEQVSGATEPTDRIRFGDSGITVDLQETMYAERIGICLETDDAYRIEYRLGTDVVGVQEKEITSEDPLLMCYFLEPPGKSVRKGYDVLRVFPLDGEPPYGIGYLRFVSEES
jgi:hypothetical protein